MGCINVGLLGLGTVGSGVYKILTQQGETVQGKAGVELVVKKILVRDLSRQRLVEVEPEQLTTDPQDIVADQDIDIVVEVLGGEEPARSLIVAALSAGKHVVTANKEVIAKHGPELLAVARDHGTQLFFEASVAGGIPIIRALQESLAGEKIEALYGIVNGTTNYILTAMTSQGRAFGEVLAEAQAKGYAEADPTADIAGHDAARKLAILTAVAFNTSVPLDEIQCTGIEDISPEDIAIVGEMGYIIKLLAITKKTKFGVEARVSPTLVPATHPLAAVDGVFNAVLVKGWAVGTLMFYGAGAGQLPTGSAVVGDLVAAAKACRGETSTVERTGFGEKGQLVPPEQVENSYYLRLSVVPHPGVLGTVTAAFGRTAVELVSLDVKNWGKDSADLIIRTRPVQESCFQALLADLVGQDDIKEVTTALPIINGE